jgi:fructan beta-fructosidase
MDGDMFYKKVLVVIILISFLMSCGSSTKHSKQIATFDTGPWGDWTKEGSAFGDGPAGTEGTHRMNGFLGHGYACSAGDLDPTSVGTITSPPFTIDKNTIHFLLGAQEIHFMAGSENYKGQLVVQLLVDDEIVRTKIPKEFHAMFWEGWDVSEFMGKIAQIKIVDNDPREWAHIDVDHIVQNNIPLAGKLFDRKIIIDKPLLNFPVKQGNAKYYLELVVDGKQIRAMDVELATDEIDYWVVTDLTPWMGKELTVRTKLKHELNDKILDRISAENDILDADDLYNEPLRQQFHFSSKRGWINDPNGLVFYDGEYHLFYQHNPYGWDHSRNDYNKTWGHAVSTDLIYWEELAGVIHPDHLGSIYSGSSVVDYNNTTGFQTGDEKPIVAIYTSAGGRTPWSMEKKFSQSIAYSNDRGRTFTIFEDNPVQENLDYINRDPKVIWHEPSQQWVIVLHFDERAMVFFTSKDLKSWQKQSEFESRYLVDCPELFELAVDGDENNKKWIIYGGSGAYYIGDFDGKKFTAQTEIIEYNFGNAFYASQTNRRYAF